MPGKKKRRTFTDEERKIIEAAFVMNMDTETLANLFSMDWSHMSDLIKLDDKLQPKVGKAKGEFTYRKKLWQKVLEGDMRAIEFWGKTQLGMKTADRLEHSGPDGRPIQTTATIEIKEPTRDEILAEMRLVNDRLKIAGF